MASSRPDKLTKPLILAVDVALHRVRQLARSLTPQVLVRSWDARRMKRRRAEAIEGLLAGECFPWISPNVWGEMVSYYRRINCARVLECGLGASTLWHVRELVGRGQGSYTGIEHDAEWYWACVAAVLRELRLKTRTLRVSVRTSSKKGLEDDTVAITADDIHLLFLLRPTLPSYLETLRGRYDVVIVDGMARKECVQIALATKPFRRRAMLALMDAGRGMPNWWEGHLQGENDYRAEVEAMMALGGVLMDGSGLDTWPGCPKRSPRPVSYCYPMEACIVVLQGRKSRP